jgi:uncharacterized protein (TIGR03067 family)
MKARVLVAVLSVFGAAAFAPAPFPRPQRRGGVDDVSVPTIQGTWRVAGMLSSRKDGKHQPYNWHINQIRIKGDVWTFVDRNGSDGTSYALVVKNDKKPAWLDFYGVNQPRQGAPPGGGIIRRKGDVVEIIYVFGGRERPVSFEQPPDGQYLLTLQRQR